jgi:S1-C subfamily serine protease
MAGQKIRCGKCHQTFTVKSSPSRHEEEEDSPRARNRSSPAPASRGAAAHHREDEDDRPVRRSEEDDASPRRRGRRDSAKGPSLLPWLVGGGIAAFVFLALGGLTLALIIRGGSSSNKVANYSIVNNPDDMLDMPIPPGVPPGIPPAGVGEEVPAGGDNAPPALPPETRPIETRPPESTPPATTRPVERDPTRRGELSREAMQLVKRATVFLRVTMADGTVASGTGFFGAPDAPNIVLTNAHVVGMLSSTSRRPQRVEVFINSGERDEKQTTARVLGVDRSSDLAVLDVGTSEGMPKPLTVKSGEALQELDKVYIFGFPLGEKLGREITIRPSSVSSLRKSAGFLDKIQVAGGMDPGNSGGPVVDESGDVVGVAVSGIPGLLINFAIPGSRVHTILHGRISEMGIGQPFKVGTKTGVPITMVMLDPRGRIKNVALEVWVGNAPDAKSPSRPPADSPPSTVLGDTPRQRYPFSYVGGIGRGEVTLPELPAGKVWWVQPIWTNVSGQTRWAAGHVYKPESPPVERKPLMLSARYASATARRLNIAVVNRLKVGPEAEAEVATILSKATISESGTGNTAGVTLQLAYQSAEQSATFQKRRRTNPTLDSIRGHLRKLVAQIDLDSTGNIRTNGILNEPAMLRSPIGQQLIEVHQPIKFALNPLLLPMPNRNVKPLENWKLQRSIGVEMPGGLRNATLDMTCTYLGVRNVASRDEAVITLEGAVRDPAMTGRGRGLAILDVSTGVIRKVDLDLDVEMPPLEFEIEEGKTEKIRVLAILSMRLERSL